ncbi:MAG: hypothetical protein KatS3mg121_1201 [Gammaproteobacteria bacterium]|nr:MAG: hypothetical protein KatS3mg121_1201 [Gammaproteobacteria bacterium]
MKPTVFLRLSRAANLPTVLSNVLVGTALAGAAPDGARLAGAMLIGALFYTAGMWANDWFDRRWDRRHRPERPLAAGEIGAGAVFAGALGMGLAAGLLAPAVAAPGRAPSAFAAAAVLAALIVAYDALHKRVPALAPPLMGACRGVLYLLPAALFGGPAPWAAAAALAAQVAGITVLAAGEHRGAPGPVWALPLLCAPLVVVFAGAGPLPWTVPAAALAAGLWTLGAWRQARRGRPGAAVGALLAGLALYDAVWLLALGRPHWALAAAAAFAAARLAQRRIAAT